MTRILINKCIDIIRKNKREHPVSDFPEYGEVSRELDNSEFNELMNSLDENTGQYSFYTMEKDLRSVRSPSSSIWKKTQ